MRNDELQDGHARLSRLMGASGGDSPLTLVAVDAERRRLVVGTNDPRVAPSLGALFREQVGGLPLTASVMRFRRHGKQQNVRPITGGLKIVTSGDAGLETGSIATIVRRTPAGGEPQLGFVTAGHTVGAVDVQVFQPSTGEAKRVGTVAAVSDYTGTARSDSAFVLADGAMPEPTVGTIWRAASDMSPTGYVTYDVAATGTAAVDEEVSMSGQNDNDGIQSGTVALTGATVTFEDGGTLTDQTLARYATAEGDSGGAVFRTGEGSGVTFFGINVGGTTEEHVDPTPAAGSYAVFSTWANVANDLGATATWEICRPA